VEELAVSETISENFTSGNSKEEHLHTEESNSTPMNPSQKLHGFETLFVHSSPS
jgi:hypothetical protein